jgi:hypothetical protein
MKKEPVKIFKLSNGENIVGMMIRESEQGLLIPSGIEINFATVQQITISRPLRMTMTSKVTWNGPVESLTLTPWIEPMSEQLLINLNPNNVIMSADASGTLLTYYNHCLDRFIIESHINYEEEKKRVSLNDILDVIKEPTDKELEDLENELANYNPKKDIVH